MKGQTAISIHDKEPSDFFPSASVAAAHVVCLGKLLLLEGRKGKEQAGCFAPPAGKVEKGESLHEALKRELYEETALALPEDSHQEPLFTLYIRKPDMDYLYHCFEVVFQNPPLVRLSSEHASYRWESPDDCKNLPLIAGGKVILEKYLRQSPFFNSFD